MAEEEKILNIQEVHVDHRNMLAFELDWDGEIIYSSVSSSARGVAVLFNPQLDYKVLKYLRMTRAIYL